MLAAGRPVPAPGETGQRGEGVAIVLTGQRGKAPSSRGKRFDVSKLTRNETADKQHGSSWREEFQQQAGERASKNWPEEGTAEDKWEVLQSALLESAETVLGTESRHQPTGLCYSFRAATEKTAQTTQDG